MSVPTPLFDRLIAPISPAWALSRARARAQLGFVRSYEGARRDRRTTGWVTASTTAVTEVRAALTTLRNRSRDMDRNNAWANRAASVKVSTQIGTGILPRADTKNPALNTAIDTAFDEWQADCAPDSGTSFFGCQAMAVRSRIVSGESLVMLQRTGRGKVPLTLQVLEADYLADDGLQSGTREGIIFDSAGYRTGYRIWDINPNDTLLSVSARGLKTRDVAASDVIHLYRADRPGQIRGVPDCSTGIMRMRDLDDYQDAALMLAKVQAVLGAFVIQSEDGTPSLGTASTDEDGKRLEELSPGMIGYLRPGEDVKFLSPQGGGPFNEYTRQALLWISSAYGIPYHTLTGDLTQANYSSLRAGWLEFRRQTEQDQELLIIPNLCEPVWRAFIAQAVLAGVLPEEAGDARAIWTPPRFEMVDPVKDTDAIIAQIRAGLITWARGVAEMGFDPDKQLAEIIAWNKKLTDGGVILDTDPRVVTGAGGPIDAKAIASIVLAAKE